MSELSVAWTRDGTRLQYELIGAGEPVVFLHGSLNGRDAFNRQLPLAEHFQLLLRDLRGHNGSEPRIPPDYGIATTEVDDLLAVLDAEGIERAHLAGHSTGGAIAVAAAQRHPERVASLVLMEPTLLALLPEPLRAEDRRQRQQVIAVAEQGSALAAADAFYSRALGRGWRARAQPSMLAQVEAAVPMLAAHNRALLDFHVTPEDIHSLCRPALFLHGCRSSPVHAAIFARLGELRPDLPRLAIEDAGHAMHRSRPQPVNAALLAFLTG